MNRHQETGCGRWIRVALKGILTVCLGWASGLMADDGMETETPWYANGQWNCEFDVMRAWGTQQFGGLQSHDMVLGGIQVGRVVTDLVGREHFYQGNLEAFGLLFGGSQDNPNTAYLGGGNLGLRYHFQTGTSVLPYFNGSLGMLGTDIGMPDLSGKFQFNEQVGGGIHWMFLPHWGLNLEYRFLHISNAGIKEPNRGINTHMVVLGMLRQF